MKFSIFALAALVLLVSSVSGAKIGAYHANFVGLATYAPNSTFDNFISEASPHYCIMYSISLRSGCAVSCSRPGLLRPCAAAAPLGA